jgi:hypothetical protein
MIPSFRRHTRKSVGVRNLVYFINKLTLTTRELALPCSYARKAVLKRGKLETLATKSGEVISAGREEVGKRYSALDDVDAEDAG